ncbi:KilA-N domain-containing protein, partial [Yersinia enterocolitica]
MQNLPVIAGVEINTDTEGRFNLNALHKASGLGANKAPAQWMRTQAAKEIVQEVIDMQICTSPMKTIKGGVNQGTFAHELLAIEYAGWISPAFRLQVNQTFLDYKTGKLQPATDPMAAL